MTNPTKRDLDALAPLVESAAPLFRSRSKEAQQAADTYAVPVLWTRQSDGSEELWVPRRCFEQERGLRKSLEKRLQSMRQIAWCLGGLFFVTLCVLVVVLVAGNKFWTR